MFKIRSRILNVKGKDKECEFELRNLKMRMLHVDSKFMKNKDDLLHIYKAFIRSRLEFSCTVWHSSLTKKNQLDIERVQKSAIKIILKEKYVNYEQALKLVGLESLHERREQLCLRFAKKCLKMENYKKLFPVRKENHTEKYLVKYMNTERYMKSAIPAMIRALNGEELKRRKLLNISMAPENIVFCNSISEKI